MAGMSVGSMSEDIVVPPARLPVEKLVPAASRALTALDEAVRKTDLERYRSLIRELGLRR